MQYLRLTNEQAQPWTRDICQRELVADGQWIRVKSHSLASPSERFDVWWSDLICFRYRSPDVTKWVRQSGAQSSVAGRTI
jgi:hypothetical protein